jgi:carbamoyltransferase
MITLGLHYGHNGAACIVRDGRLVAAIASERISRCSKSHGVTQEVLDYVFGVAGITVDDIDFVGLSDWHNDFAQGTIEVRKNRQPIHNLWDQVAGNELHFLDATIRGKMFPAFHMSHHMCHAAAAYYTSNFDSAHCFTLDASGAKMTNNCVVAKGEGLELKALYCPQLLVGVAYGYFTEWLGVGGQMHKAGATMGLAAYGSVLDKVIADLDGYVSGAFITEDNGHHAWMNWLWRDLSGQSEPFREEQKFTQQAMDIAATIQFILEQCVLRAVNRIPEGNLCLGGGTMLNCSANTAILKTGRFENIHLFPACTDDGGAIGIALYIAHHILREPRHTYTDREVAYLGKDRISAAPDYAALAQDIADGKIVAWYQGRAEYGPRALGNRSIFADPRSPTMRDKLNLEVKKREWFRPFAPIVLEEHCHEWFDFPAAKSPFMLFTGDVKKPDLIPAVTHIDGTSRMQTLSRDMNPSVHSLITAFYELTGVPMLLNTSLNLGGQPMVESEADVQQLWDNMPVDILVNDGVVARR